ncbi:MULTISPECIES: calcium-binding protein [Mameliella]|uniref:calcium-binding protein n=1 Tax=Mameliella TaxID=1434019 RepID=UPI000B5381DF|nr:MULTISPECIES: calcium-binding protein [Mameliella]MCR9273642.1 calcium-binding protein [Paracoccaceae bacterium]OWV56821.1 hypothetical protein CDZ98_17565 [Mameliella alba]
MTLVFQNVSQNSGVTVNNGDTLAIRDFVDLYSAGTIVTLSSGTSTTGVVNDGDLYGYLVFNVNSDHSRIVNNGTVSAIISDGNTGEAFNLGGAGGIHRLTNFGTITAQGSLLATYEATGPVTIVFTNHGEAFTDSQILTTLRANLNSFYLNNAGFLAGGTLDMAGGFLARLMNTGTLHSSFIDMDATSGATLVNHGIIADENDPTTVLTSNVGDSVVNSGVITGNLNLLNGNDRYEALNAGIVSGGIQGSNGNDTISGGSGDDSLAGGNDQDLLVGRDGEDTLEGGAGFDTLLGGNGNDLLDGGNNNDTLNGNAGNDTLNGGFGNDLLVGQQGEDLLEGGPGNDTMDGGADNDVLEGGADNDILRGRAGEDALAGGLGRDLLTGGQDADIFVFRSAAETVVGANRDQILDFQQGVDLISVAGLSPGVFEFRGTAGFAPSGNPELRLFETATGSTIVQLDVDGDGNADAEIRVANVTGLTADDFAL